MRSSPVLIAALFALCAAAPVAAQRAATTSPAISAADLRQRVYDFADDSMQGRDPDAPDGYQRSLAYLLREVERMGLTPAGGDGTFLQRVPIVRRRVAGGSLAVDGRALAYGTDFLPGRATRPFAGIEDVEAVAAGVFPDDSAGLTDDMATGRVVVVSWTSSGRPSTRFMDYIARMRFPTAAVVAYAMLDDMDPLSRTAMEVPVSGLALASMPAGGPAVVYVSGAAAGQMLGQPVTGAKPGDIGVRVTMRFDFEETPIPAYNVIAVIPGSDPSRAGQYVAIGSHADHVGLAAGAVDHDSLRAVNVALNLIRIREGAEAARAKRGGIVVNMDSLRALRPARFDSIYNGADDDASGSMALMEIAESLARPETRPARSTLFIWHAVEEMGLVGSRWFMDHPTVPRDSIVAYLNVDMAGRGGAEDIEGGGPRYVQLIGTRRISEELGDWVEDVNRELGSPFDFDYTYDAAGHPDRLYCRSDQASYARYSIPVADFGTGLHADYHQLTDEPQYIDYQKLEGVARVMGGVLQRVGNAPARPRIDHPVTDPDAPCVQ